MPIDMNEIKSVPLIEKPDGIDLNSRVMFKLVDLVDKQSIRTQNFLGPDIELDIEKS